MKYPIIELPRDRFPPKLLEIPDPPERLYIRGAEMLLGAAAKILAVVGAREFSKYGEDVCRELIRGLRGEPVIIVSGLALGIDSIAHEAALSCELPTISIPGSGLNQEVIHPPSHKGLALKILEKGGLLLSEFEPDFRATVDSFPRRNRIMAGLSDAILIIEAEQKSGTMITARLAAEYNRDVLTVPGSIFSKNSAGPHQLIRSGATPISSSIEILEALGLGKNLDSIGSNNDPNKYRHCSPEELVIIENLRIPQSRDALLEKLGLPTSQVNSLLTILELKDLIKESAGEIYLK